MQDMGIRAVYDGLRGQGNRFGQLEQFFIALRIKEPVKLHVEGTKREYYASDQIISDMVEIRKEGWGYLPGIYPEPEPDHTGRGLCGRDLQISL